MDKTIYIECVGDQTIEQMEDLYNALRGDLSKLTDDNARLERKQSEAYKRGFIDGMTAYSFDVGGYVAVGQDHGCKMGHTRLSDAIKNVEELINFNPDGD